MSEARLRAVVDTVIYGVILFDEHGSVQMYNPACERLFGYSSDEIVGRNVKALMPQPFHAAHDSYLENFHSAGVPKIIGLGREFVGRRKDGTTFPMAFSLGGGSQDGEPFFVGIVDDITERRRASEQRDLLTEQLVASNEELGFFARAASHDLQEPLRMVSAFCGLLSERYGDSLNDQAREYLALAVSGSLQMRDLLDDLLDYSRLGLEAERASWFEAEQCFSVVVENLNESIRASGAVVSLDPLPRLLGNSIRFTRLAQNLIGNALKYVAPGNVPRVHVSAERKGEFWFFSIADNGIGIDQSYHETVFEPFKRLHSKAEYYGTGLGLAICAKIVEGFGGAISVRSALGEGSTFGFSIKQITEEPDHG